ncbi:GNAT family N-acetyltransferase [Brevibacillus migulae]|uniref:GNAT family N-acetyltransferase n=1 Tax=Brevibacillus migulae TaxID=1644114 RepID=UPI00106DE701|nr:GNAT family protein [Brevibacillus migulae]
MQIKPLTTDRLQLSPLQLDDAQDLYAIWSDAKVTRHMNITAFTDVKQAEEMIALLQELAQEEKACRFSIQLKPTNTIIGSCGFNYLDFENERAEIGYELGYSYWGNGYVTEALHSLLAFGFQELGLNRIEAKVEPENTNSIKVLQKLGFVEEGLLRQYEKLKGVLVDLHLYSLLRNEWTMSPSPAKNR